jgi:hypothetical protein
MACILDKMNGLPRINNPETTTSSIHMSGEFAEIDLAMGINIETKIN